MSCKKKGVPFTGSEEQKQALMQVIDALKSEKGALMPIMQKAQEIYGYLPIEVQQTDDIKNDKSSGKEQLFIV